MRIVCPDPDYKGEPNVGPVYIHESVSIPHYPTQEQTQVDLFHALWHELHSKQDPTTVWCEDWCKRVPRVGCGCQTWLADYLLANPPRYDDFFAYSVDLHNAVSAKLNKEKWTLERAREHYQP